MLWFKTHNHFCYCSLFQSSVLKIIVYQYYYRYLGFESIYFPLGNGVVIHLPGLFEEAEKNVQKGKGMKE